MIAVDRPRESSVPIVLPGTIASLVIDDKDHIDRLGCHIRDVLLARIANSFQVSPSRMRMEVPHQRQMRNAFQKALNSTRCAAVFLYAAMCAPCGLIRESVLDDVNI